MPALTALAPATPPCCAVRRAPLSSPCIGCVPSLSCPPLTYAAASPPASRHAHCVWPRCLPHPREPGRRPPGLPPGRPWRQQQKARPLARTLAGVPGHRPHSRRSSRHSRSTRDSRSTARPPWVGGLGPCMSRPPPAGLGPCPSRRHLSARGRGMLQRARPARRSPAGGRGPCAACPAALRRCASRITRWVQQAPVGWGGGRGSEQGLMQRVCAQMGALAVAAPRWQRPFGSTQVAAPGWQHA